MENKNLVFLPDDVYKELKKIGKDFNDADDPETIAILIYAFKIELLHSQIVSLEADSTTLELLINAIKSAIKKSDYSSGYDLDSKYVLDAFKVLLPDDYSDRIDELKIEEDVDDG